MQDYDYLNNFKITQNGTKLIKDIHLNCETFAYFYNHVSKMHNFHVVSDQDFQIASYGLCCKAYVLFHSQGDYYHIICNSATISAYIVRIKSGMIEVPEAIKKAFKELDTYIHRGYDYIFTQDPSLKEHVSYSSSNIPARSRNWLKKAVESKLTKDEFQGIIDKFGLPSRPLPLRKRSQESTQIIKWNDCTEMDIHKAHASELLKIFKGTKVEPTIQKAIKQAFSKDKNVSKHWKDMLNMAVGNFALKSRTGSNKGQTIKWCYGLDTSPLYNKIVTDIRAKIENQLAIIRNPGAGKLVYAQTDGFIYQHAKNVKDSPDLGEFGIKSQGVVYTYHQPTIKGVSTGYTIYQVGDRVVGDLPDSLKKYIDLRVGQVVVYQRVVEDSNYVSARLLQIKKEFIDEK